MSAVAEGVDMAYDTDGLRTGAGQAGEAAGTADDVAATLAGVACATAMFGVVAGAAGLATAVLRSRDAHRGVAEQTAAVHVGVADRAGRIANDGDGLTAGSTSVAGRGAPTAGA